MKSLWRISEASAYSIARSSSAWVSPRAQSSARIREASGAAGSASIPRNAAFASHSTSGSRGIAPSAVGRNWLAWSAIRRALPGWLSQSAANSTASIFSSLRANTDGLRNWRT